MYFEDFVGEEEYMSVDDEFENNNYFDLNRNDHNFDIEKRLNIKSDENYSTKMFNGTSFGLNVENYENRSPISYHYWTNQKDKKQFSNFNSSWHESQTSDTTCNYFLNYHNLLKILLSISLKFHQSQMIIIAEMKKACQLLMVKSLKILPVPLQLKINPLKVNLYFNNFVDFLNCLLKF